MNLTVEEAVSFHRILWNGIVEELEENGIGTRSSYKIKHTVRERLFPEFENEFIREDCFLCDFVVGEENREEKDCMKCPMVKTVTLGCLNYRYGNFHAACMEKDVGKALEYARQIAELRVTNELYKESVCYGS